MKKLLDNILLCIASFFGVLLFIFMALPVLKGNISGGTVSTYGFLDDGGFLVAFLFTIISFLVSIFLFLVAMLSSLGKKKMDVPFKEYIALGVALLSLVAFILFLAVPASKMDDYGLISMGAGAILCAISSFIVSASLCYFGLVKVLKK